MKYNLNTCLPKRPVISLKLMLVLTGTFCFIIFFVMHPVSIRSIVKESNVLYELLVERIAARAGSIAAIHKSAESVVSYGVRYKQWEISVRLAGGVDRDLFWRSIRGDISESYQVEEERSMSQGQEVLRIRFAYKGKAIGLLLLTNANVSVEEAPAVLKDTETVAAVRPPQTQYKGRVVFIIDDIGYTRKHEKLLFSLPHAVVLSVLPRLSFSRYYAEEGHRRGYDIMLHLPLEAEKSRLDPGPGAIRSFMTDEEIRDMVEKNIDLIPSVIGVNNHMGSKITADPAIMKIIMAVLKSRGLFFLDSITSRNTAAGPVADVLGVPYVRRHVFLDNNNDPQYIKDQIIRLIAHARTQGTAIGIGHYRRNTLQALADSMPLLHDENIALVRITDVVQERTGLYEEAYDNTRY